ncbi:sulfite exporter TauE/SafE family protein [Oceanobacillus damuensis]|uniref:sulfite exporter TauE/SafE family protein n=1 Tax=Oceanobacillus damuensis TaxID=937928 RepID=UPI001F43292C|nr:sulfite exporter TauE/SafE family protein [Oceanobacillus damuensis]
MYFLIGLSASLLGAMAGLGGGIIIKPVLDLFGHYDLATIGVLSAATVLAMATVSLIQVRHMDANVDKKIGLLIAFGSILGGFLGKGLFNFLLNQVNSASMIGMLQSGLLAIILAIIFLYVRYKGLLKSYQLYSKGIILSVGIILGMLSSFLGIGGGPLNVAVLYLLFSMNAKNAVVNSTFIIFFSQLSALALIAVTEGFGDYDLSMIGYMIVGGIIGGFIGSKLVNKLANVRIELVFNSTLMMIILLNVYNLIKYIL